MVIPKACTHHGHLIIESTDFVAQHLAHRSVAFHPTDGVLHDNALRTDVTITRSCFRVEWALLGRFLRYKQAPMVHSLEACIDYDAHFRWDVSHQLTAIYQVLVVSSPRLAG